MHDTQKGHRRNIARQALNRARPQVDNHRVPETLGHKSHTLVVGRNVGALAEVSEDFDVCGQVLQRVVGRSLACQKHNREQEDEGTHAGNAITGQTELMETDESSAGASVRQNSAKCCQGAEVDPISSASSAAFLRALCD